MPMMQHAGYVSGLQEALHGTILSHYTSGGEHCSSRGLWHRISDLVYTGQPFYLHIQTNPAETYMSAKYLYFVCVSLLCLWDSYSFINVKTSKLLTGPFRVLCLWHLLHQLKAPV